MSNILLQRRLYDVGNPTLNILRKSVARILFCVLIRNVPADYTKILVTYAEGDFEIVELRKRPQEFWICEN